VGATTRRFFPTGKITACNGQAADVHAGILLAGDLVRVNRAEEGIRELEKAIMLRPNDSNILYI
jgi:hypothetical protein